MALSLPAAILVLLAGTVSLAATSEVTVEGRLVEVHSDDFTNGRAGHEYRLVTDEGAYALEFAGGRPELPRATNVSIRGRRSGNTILVAVDGIEAAVASTTTSAVTTGAKKVAVILFTFSDNPSEPYTPAYAEGVAFTNTNSAAAYYDEASWGKLMLSGNVFGWYQIPEQSTSCNFSRWANAATQAASGSGVDLSAYDYHVYAFPTVSACTWTGLSYLTGTESWLNGSAGMSLHVLAHELGHNFGTHHASSYSCVEAGVRVPLSADDGNCSSLEYGDNYSVMGGVMSRRLHTGFSRGNLGWLTAANTLDVSGSGTYGLAPLGPYNSTAVQELRITRDASTYFLLEFRQPYNSHFDNFPSTDHNGVVVRIVPSYETRTQSQLVDASPETNRTDSALTVGRSLDDPLSGVTFTTTAISAAGATVRVEFAQDAASPTAPTNLSASAIDPLEITLNWTPSTDNVGVAGYKVFRGGSYLATSTSPSYTDSGLTPDTAYSYVVTAVDDAGNQSAASNTATVRTPAVDTIAPSAPTNLGGSATDGTNVLLTWSPATDNVGVAGYRVRRDGTVIGQTSSTDFTDSGLEPSTTYTYSVTAFDAAGNGSSTSPSVSATTLPIADTQPPSSPEDLQATIGKGRKVQLSWLAASDNLGVMGYEIVRDEVAVATVTDALTYVDNARRGVHTYYVVAVDAAGNRSLPSIFVTVAI